MHKTFTSLDVLAVDRNNNEIIYKSDDKILPNEGLMKERKKGKEISLAHNTQQERPST